MRLSYCRFALALVTACTKPAPSAPLRAEPRAAEVSAPSGRIMAASSHVVETTHTEASAPLDNAIERITGAAAPTDRLPLLIVLHGLGGGPEEILSVYTGLSARARVVSLRGTFPFGPGHGWFHPRGAGDWNAEFRAAVDGVVQRISAISAARPSCPSVTVSGFSQGAMLSFALIARRENVSHAFPLGGYLPRQFWPEGAAIAGLPTTIHAFHGESDLRISLADDVDTIAQMNRTGFAARLHRYPGVGHTINASMQRELLPLLDAALRDSAC